MMADALGGIFVTILLIFIGWHIIESGCQKKHNVYDCTIQIRAIPVDKEKDNG